MLVFCGTIAHSTEDRALEILEDTVIGVEKNEIKFIGKKADLQKFTDDYKFSTEEISFLDKDEFLIPGFVDTHIHASQYVNSGKALDLRLLDWLHQYTYPLEDKFKDTETAARLYTDVVKRTLRNGTTTACYFATIHSQSCEVFCDILEKYGQRALVGKVCCDMNVPEYYKEETGTSISESDKFVSNILQRQNSLLLPIVTPRFPLSCTPELMKSLGDLAQKNDIHIQTHLNEAIEEVKLSKKYLPSYHNITELLNATNLLTSKTVLAHCIYMDEDEVDLLKSTGAGVAHCPNSNISIRSGLCDVRRMIDRGIKVGLGTDVSGGYSPSILDAIRMATTVSNVLCIQNAATNYRQLSYQEVFYLATLGGSQVLGMEKKIGNFQVGKDFDALHISLRVPDSSIDLYPEDTTSDKFQKFLYLGDDRNIQEVYVAGRKVHQRNKAMHNEPLH